MRPRLASERFISAPEAGEPSKGQRQRSRASRIKASRSHRHGQHRRDPCAPVGLILTLAAISHPTRARMVSR